MELGAADIVVPKVSNETKLRMMKELIPTTSLIVVSQNLEALGALVGKD